MEKRKYEEYEILSNKIYDIVFMTLNKFIADHQDDDECLYEIKKYINKVDKYGFSCNVEKVKIILETLQLKNKNDIQEILSYLEKSSCGWQGDNYQLYNTCLRFDRRCRRNHGIENDPEATKDAFAEIDEIFLHEEYGAITTYLFGYSLAAMFSSRLKDQDRSIPYFLQIACKRNSNTYRLVHEIVHICDVNTGLFSYCDAFHYRECNHDHMTICPTEAGGQALDTLLYFQDIPIIVDGYGNEKLYEVLIREAANIPSKTKRLDLRAKFNVLPIFVCPAIKSQFQDIFSMDLTDLDIPDEYIEIIHENRQRLGSWALELVRDAKTYFDERNSSAYSLKPKIAAANQSRIPDDELPLLYNFDEYRNRLWVNYSEETKLNPRDITNIGYVMYFFSYYMKVFLRSIRLTKETGFTYRNRHEKHDPVKLIAQIEKQATDSMFQLYNTYSPAMPETVNIAIDSSDKAEVKRIRRKGTAYARDIVKYYQSYGVTIRILPDAEYKGGRYIFTVKLVPGTDKKLINRHIEDVRGLLEIDVLALDTSNGIKLIASEKPLNENSLIKILESTQFKESKMNIPYAIGYDLMGDMVITDIADFPHLLIGGTSGSGKSSAIHSLLMSIVYKQPADKVKLLLMDFGASRLRMFKDVPHMLIPGKVISDIREGHQFILKLQEVVEQRQKILDSLDVRDYDKQLKKWSSIVCVIDEFPAFIKQLTEGRGNKNASGIIEDVLARARKVKIHLILAAQDTTQGGMGITNTNLAAGIAFRCKNWHTSKAIIDDTDAINLSGKGSMCFKCDQGLRRLQGAYMPPEEIMDVLDNMKYFYEKRYDEVILQSNSLREAGNSENNQQVPLYTEDERILLKIVEDIQDKEKYSNHQIMKSLKMGHDRAKRLIDRLEEIGIIGKLEEKKRRDVYPDKAKAFLRDHGYVEDANKEKLVKCLEPSSMQDIEPRQEQDIRPNDREADIKNCVVDSDQASKSISQLVKENSDRYKFKSSKVKIRPAR